MRAIFLDTETNGLNVFQHVILEIAYKVVDIATGEEVTAFERVIRPSDREWDLSMPESLEINGFSEERAFDGEERAKVIDEIKTHFKEYNLLRGEAVFICQNPSFDRGFVSKLVTPEEQEAESWPYHWLDLASMHWASCVMEGVAPWHAGLSKDSIAEYHQIKAEEMPHRAMNGVNHLIECYRAILPFKTLKN